jgi:LCP family protein required for cell wall assembly
LSKREKKKQRKKGKGKILFIIIPLLLIIGTFVFSYSYVNNKIYVPNANDFFGSKEEQEAAKYDEEQGIINIMLVGLDGRENDQDARTDSIILATLDTNNKRVKLTSFMRDMYVPIPGYKGNRINAAYFFGGPELLMKTMNEDFGLNIQYYVSIDFKAFQQLVDKMGGIDIEVKDYEVDEINKYIKEVNGVNSTLLQGAGFQHLNGQQALSYSRIRHVGILVLMYGSTELNKSGSFSMLTFLALLIRTPSTLLCLSVLSKSLFPTCLILL